MSSGEAAFLILVLCAFATFIGVVGFVSIWSRKPSTKKPATAPGAVASESSAYNLRKAA